jgi:hypothetical protein
MQKPLSKSQLLIHNKLQINNLMFYHKQSYSGYPIIFFCKTYSCYQRLEDRTMKANYHIVTFMFIGMVFIPRKGLHALYPVYRLAPDIPWLVIHSYLLARCQHLPRPYPSPSSVDSVCHLRLIHPAIHIHTQFHLQLASHGIEINPTSTYACSMP